MLYHFIGPMRSQSLIIHFFYSFSPFPLHVSSGTFDDLVPDGGHRGGRCVVL